MRNIYTIKFLCTTFLKVFNRFYSLKVCDQLIFSGKLLLYILTSWILLILLAFYIKLCQIGLGNTNTIKLVNKFKLWCNVKNRSILFKSFNLFTSLKILWHKNKNKKINQLFPLVGFAYASKRMKSNGLLDLCALTDYPSLLGLALGSTLDKAVESTDLAASDGSALGLISTTVDFGGGT